MISQETTATQKTVVVVGSMWPEAFKDSDADINVGAALGILSLAATDTNIAAIDHTESCRSTPNDETSSNKSTTKTVTTTTSNASGTTVITRSCESNCTSFTTAAAAVDTDDATNVEHYSSVISAPFSSICLVAISGRLFRANRVKREENGIFSAIADE